MLGCKRHRCAMPDTGIQTQPNPPHLRRLNAGSLSSEHEVSCQVHALPSRISYRLNCTSSGDHRKVCRGHLCPWSRPCQEPSPEKLTEGRTHWWNWVTSFLLSFSAQIIIQESNSPEAHPPFCSMSVSDRVQGPHLGADLQT